MGKRFLPITLSNFNCLMLQWPWHAVKAGSSRPFGQCTGLQRQWPMFAGHGSDVAVTLICSQSWKFKAIWPVHWAAKIVASVWLLDMAGRMTDFQWFRVRTHADSSVPVLPLCAQHALRSLWKIVSHVHLLIREGLAAGWYENRQTMYNGSKIKYNFIAPSGNSSGRSKHGKT